jgi:putative transposase
VRSVKNEGLSQLMLFGARALWRALAEYNIHYHEKRPHEGKGNGVPMRSAQDPGRNGPIRCYERLGGLPKYYYRKAA